ncbi:MAG: MFS transporter [candidate division NC10 bacterium]|nr:MFS transporter [candidate division NC10 bacterium]
MRKLSIALACLSHTIVDGSQNILPVVLALLVDRLHLSYGQVVMAAALLNVSSSVIQPGFGWISDRCPTRWFMSGGIAWTGLFMSVVGLVPSYPMLLLVLVLTGLGTAAFHPIASIAVTHASGDRRGFGMSFFSAGGNLGFAIGPVVAAWLMTWLGLQGTVLVIIPGLLMAAAMYVWRGEFASPAPVHGAHEPQARAPIPWGRLSRLCAIITLRSWGYSGLVVFIPLLLHEQGVSLSLAGRALFVFLFFGALGGMLGGHLSDRIGRQQVIVASLVSFPFFMAIAMLLSGPFSWLFLAIAGISLLASFSVTVVFAQELLPHHLGVASGLTLGLSFGAGGVGVGLSGLLADLFGLQTSVWLLVLLPGIAGLIALTLSPPRDRRA